MSDKIVPLIGSGVAGPLGAIHLPRLWQKVSLSAAGKLADGYDACGQGYDQMTLDGLGVDRDAAVAYITENKPSYTEFEAWVKANGSKTDAASIEASNGAIRGYNHGDEVRAGIFVATGLTDDTCSFRSAVDLNNLDDWAEFHAAEIKG